MNILFLYEKKLVIFVPSTRNQLIFSGKKKKIREEKGIRIRTTNTLKEARTLQ